MAMLEPHLNDWRDVVYHPLRVERVDRAFTVKPLHKSQIGEPIRIDDPIIHMIRYGNPLATSGTTVKRELIIATGGFNENIELASVEDFDLWLRLATAGARFYFLPQILGTYWVGENHISNFSERQFERQRHLFLHQLELLPDRYRSKAQSNFSYLLGSYALSLNLPNAQTYFNELKFMVEPIRWIKSRVKLWDAELKKVFKN
jgi:GT2 family glycosyltransferase